MGRNNKSFGTDSDGGDQLVGSIPFEVLDSRSSMDDSVPGDEIARNMALLAKLVAKRRDAPSDGVGVQHPQDFSADETSQPEGLAFTPVRIILSDDDEVLIVASIAEAIECLTSQWPVRYGAAFEDALQACVDGVKGKISPEQVRSAFVNAANAAGIRIIP